MKIVIVGGSAFSTPALFRYLKSQTGANHFQVILAGRSRERTLAVERAVGFICEARPIPVTSTGMSLQELTAAFREADLVLLQIRPGGLAARAIDEKFPNRYGLCGDEGLGCSGLRSGWRAWPSVRSILNVIVDVCPCAAVILMTAPLGILTRAAKSCFPAIKLLPICELPWTTLKKIAAKAGVIPDEIKFDYAGINHLGWFHRLEAGSRNLLAEFAAEQDSNGPFPSGELVLDCSAFPTSYLRLHYYPQEVLEEQRCQSTTRGASLQDLSAEAFIAYRNGQCEEITASLKLRSTPWYDEAVGPMITALCTGQSASPFFLSVPNNGYDPQLRDDDLLEIAHDFRNGSFERRPPAAKVPFQVHDVLVKFIEYERLATEAVLDRDQSKVARALLAHPWIKDYRVVPALSREITEKNPLE